MSLGLLKGRNSDFPSDRREVVKEFLQRMPALKVIDERLQRNARPNENWSTAENIRIGVNDRS
ncbi:MAG: hypothetical protein A3F74_05725 [Betaproteobacteria bacterium RIFCSPLOWO2_12_FULL_62_58]|nr:MAG: hypothetical protein A3F74_05725 [Betaproteobacteria bacterium RIFCSPLOWO2_12_FULL_62_58]